MVIKNRQELIKEYINFFVKNGHKEIPNVSLIPINDPTALFTSAGMHPLVPYLLGQTHPIGKRLVNVQRCIRTTDIDEVGDPHHHTFIEMLGNWSLGDYFKKEAIEFSFEFLTKSLNIPLEKLAITIFKGDKNSEKDMESVKIWESLGIKKQRIAFLGEDNWWGPVGETGPCGPSTEMFYWTGKTKPPANFNPNDEKWREIGNDVLMEYNKTKKGFEKAKQKNIDFGGGVERILTVINGLDDHYQSSVFKPIIKKIENISGKKYKGNERPMRIIADHIKAAVMIINDGVIPSNVEQGYILRRLIRRAIRNLRNLGVPILEMDVTVEVAKAVIPIYPDYKLNKELIFNELKQEETKFQTTLEKGLKEFEKMSKDKLISGQIAFLLFQSYGFPIEMTKELAKEKKIKVDEKGFEYELKKHQELSRTATQGKFKSGLADQSDKTKKLHTSCHLLDEALRKVLKDEEIKQKGSNINPERLRFDFNFPRKLTEKEIKEIESWINDKIKKAIPVKREEMPLQKAIESGAGYLPQAKYPDIVSVYTISDKNKVISKEICTGPHVPNTKELGKFNIKKEESSSAGIRRIKATLI